MLAVFPNFLISPCFYPCHFSGKPTGAPLGAGTCYGLASELTLTGAPSGPDGSRLNCTPIWVGAVAGWVSDWRKSSIGLEIERMASVFEHDDLTKAVAV